MSDGPSYSCCVGSMFFWCTVTTLNMCKAARGTEPQRYLFASALLGRMSYRQPFNFWMVKGCAASGDGSQKWYKRPARPVEESGCLKAVAVPEEVTEPSLRFSCTLHEQTGPQTPNKRPCSRSRRGCRQYTAASLAKVLLCVEGLVISPSLFYRLRLMSLPIFHDIAFNHDLVLYPLLVTLLLESTWGS